MKLDWRSLDNQKYYLPFQTLRSKTTITTIKHSTSTAIVFTPGECKRLTAILTFCCIPRWLPMGSVFDKTLHKVREAVIMSAMLLLLKHLAPIRLLIPSALNFTCDSQQAQTTPSTKPHGINEWTQMLSKQCRRGFLDECTIYYLSRTRWICSPVSTHDMVGIERSK